MSNQFKVGDRVEFNDPHYDHPYDHGYGTVVEVSESGNLYDVDFDANPGNEPPLTYWEFELRPEMFKTGDRVRVVNNAYPAAMIDITGWVGTIREYGDDWIIAETESGIERIVYTEEIEHYAGE